MGHSESRDAIVCRELVTELLYRNAFSSQDTLDVGTQRKARLDSTTCRVLHSTPAAHT